MHPFYHLIYPDGIFFIKSYAFGLVVLVANFLISLSYSCLSVATVKKVCFTYYLYINFIVTVLLHLSIRLIEYLNLTA
jgi:hypothetical protein